MRLILLLQKERKSEVPMEKITMSKKYNLSIQEAFDLLIRKCKIKNLTDLFINSYEKKMIHFYEFIDKSERAFLYFCTEDRYIPTFNIQLIRAEKK